MTFLNDCRLKKKLSIYAVAKASNLPYKTVHGVMTGRTRFPTRKTLEALKYVLGFTWVEWAENWTK